jgi:hypothetical protein
MTYPQQPGQGHDPGAQQHYQPQPTQQWSPAEPPAHPTKQKPKWPWIVGGVVLLLVVAGIAGGGKDGAQNPGQNVASAPSTVTVTMPAPAPNYASSPSTTAAPIVDVVLPEVKGRNGGIVYDELQKLGLTNVAYASRDKEDQVVLFPPNWTAIRIEPKAGTTVKSNDTVVVTMTKTR